MKPLQKECISHIYTSPDICLLIEKNMHAQLNEIGNHVVPTTKHLMSLHDFLSDSH